MKNSDRAQFGLAVSALAAVFRQEPTEALLEGYWMGLSDLELGSVQQAIARAMRSARFMPVVVELRELAGEMPPAVRAVKAWDAFGRGVAKHGVYASVDFDDAVINATVRNLGGWEVVLVQMEEEGNKWVRKDFERIYSALATSGISPDAGEPLIGIRDRTNCLHGHRQAIKPPAKVLTGLPPHPPGVISLPHVVTMPVELLGCVAQPIAAE